MSARAAAATLVDAKLVTQGKHLELEGDSCSEACAERRDEGNEDGHHGGEQRLPQPYPFRW